MRLPSYLRSSLPSDLPVIPLQSPDDLHTIFARARRCGFVDAPSDDESIIEDDGVGSHDSDGVDSDAGDGDDGSDDDGVGSELDSEGSEVSEDGGDGGGGDGESEGAE